MDQSIRLIRILVISKPNLSQIHTSSSASPWAAPAALSKVDLAIVHNTPSFPTCQELDNEFDGWPESGNPLVEDSRSPEPTPQSIIIENTAVLHATIRSPATIIADLVRSDDKLFFVAYAPQRSQERKEWKLVRINLEQSLQHHPQCLQDGRFLAEFYIEHYRDIKIKACHRRFWLEYHKTNSHKTLSSDYHILQPSQYSETAAKRLHLIPFRDWIQIDDPAINIHGPFEFATLQGRKTRDRIATSDWQALAHRQSAFHNPAPAITADILHLDVTQPLYEQVSNQEVAARCQNFMFHLEFNDQTLADYGTPPPPS